MAKDCHVVACLSDFHCGHTLGLLNPNTAIKQKGQADKRFSLGAVQQHLWRVYTGCLDDLQKLAGRNPVTLFFNGDITHGVKYLDAVSSVSIHEQIQVAVWCIKEALNRRRLRVKHVRFLLGTQAHTVDGTTEQLITDVLSALYPSLDIAVCHHGLYNIGDITFDVAHHGPSVGVREWTKPNVAILYCRSLMMREIARGNEPPGVVLRSHRHRALHEQVRYARRVTEMVVTPSFCGMNGHGVQVTQSLDEQDHGLFAFVVRKGVVEVVEMYETIDLRVKEDL